MPRRPQARPSSSPLLDPVQHRTMRAIGDEIRQLREEAKLSQQAIADLFASNRSNVSKLEHGTINISIVDYLKIMDVLRFNMPDNGAAHPGVQLAVRFLRPQSKRVGTKSASAD